MDDATLQKDGFRFLEGLTHADYAFEAVGKDLSELFTHAGKALCTAMVNPKTVASTTPRKIKMSKSTVEELLYEFLEEIVFIKDAEYYLAATLTVEVQKEPTGFVLDATLKGEEINPQRHHLENDVKAITYHLFKVEQTDSGYRAQVILDV